MQSDIRVFMEKCRHFDSTSNIIGKSGQQDDLCCSRYISNAHCTAHPRRNGATAITDARPRGGQKQRTAKRGAKTLRPMVKKADVKYPLSPVIRLHRFELNSRYGCWT